MRAIALCVLLLGHAPAMAQGLNRPALGEPGGFDALQIMPDDLVPLRWDAAAVPGYGIAAARADGFTPALGDAVLAVECKIGRGGPQMSVLLLYWPDGAVTAGDSYALDLFNSAISGRPAAYSFGEVWVDTSDLAFRMNESPPAIYHDRVATFAGALATAPTTVVRFDTGAAGLGPVEVLFGAAGAADALAGLRASQVCPS